MQTTQLSEILKSIYVLAENNQYPLAIEKLDTLISHNKKNHYLYNMRGVIHLQHNQLDLSEKDLKKSKKIKPDFAAAHSNLGILYRTQGRVTEAENCFRRAIKIDTQDVNTRLNLASLLNSERQFIQANKIYKELIELIPEDAQVNTLYGNSLVELNNIEEAIIFLKKAASIKPESNIFNDIGLCYMYLGEEKKAEEFYYKSIELDDLNLKAYYNLSGLKNHKFNENKIDFLCKIGDKLDEEDNVLRCFVLADIYRKNGDCIEEMRCLHEGNKIQYKNHPYEHRRRVDYFNKIKIIYDKSKDELDIKEESDIKLIFIVGMPRSGTTLLEHLISNHESVYGAGELTVIGSKLKNIIENNYPAKKIISELRLLRNEYLNSLRALTDKRIIIDKLPDNFMYSGFIQKLFPEATIIHLSREPLANSLSIYQQKFESRDLAYAFDMQAIIKFYELYRDLMAYWRTRMVNFMEVSYEDLVTVPNKTVGDIFNHLDLNYSENILTTKANKKFVKTASVNQVREKIHTQSIRGWEKYKEFIGPLASYFQPN